MNSRYILLCFIVFHAYYLSVFSQNDTIWLGRSTGLQISGFARIDYLYDSRQTAEAVEGLFTFYPLNKQIDANGKDINAAPRSNFISIASRLSARFYAPDVFGAKSSAYVEFDFTGTTETNGVRMRQAYTNLAWEKSNLLLGRTWHPLAASCIPTVPALNTGAPFWAFNRSDMIRFDYTPAQWLFSAAAVYQSNYASLGPRPGTAATSEKSSNYLRDALLPEFVAHIAYKGQAFRLGAVGSIKTIKPRQFTMPDYNLSNGPRYKTNEKLTTGVAMVYAQYQKSKWNLKAQANYAQNATESLMLGGYAVKANYPHHDTGHEKYTPTQHMTYWVNLDYGTKWQVGLFAGYINSLGTLSNAINQWYARAPDIQYMYRISPHVFYNVNNWQFAAELEYTAAAYGTIDYDRKAKITNASEVANIRSSLLVCFYF